MTTTVIVILVALAIVLAVWNKWFRMALNSDKDVELESKCLKWSFRIKTSTPAKSEPKED